MLFGLLLWDCLFVDVPDTLRTQFQLCPLDLNTPHFYEVTGPATMSLAFMQMICWVFPSTILQGA